MTLRATIEAAIKRNATDPEAAALAVCVALERKLDLAGNGWFDNDKAVLKAIGWDDDEGDDDEDG